MTTHDNVIGLDNLKEVHFSDSPPLRCLHSKMRKGVLFCPTKIIKKCIFGNVWMGREMHLSPDKRKVLVRKVAIKIVTRPPNKESSENPVSESVIHQYISRNADCKFISKSIEVIEEGNFIYMVSEYCVAEVFDLVHREGEFDEPTARQLFRQIAMAVGAMHRSGVVHRDLSLENIMLSENGEVRLIDFGMADFIPPSGNINGIKGKAYYMSPALYYEKSGYNAKNADIWSLGPILCILLIGYPPWEEAKVTDKRFVRAVNGNLAQTLRECGYNLSPTALDLMQKLMRWYGEHEDIIYGTRDAPLTIPEILAHPWLRDG
jgi:serine/threonine protein kinase